MNIGLVCVSELSNLAVYTAWNEQSLLILHPLFWLCLCVYVWLNTNFIIIEADITKLKNKIKCYPALPKIYGWNFILLGDQILYLGGGRHSMYILPSIFSLNNFFQIKGKGLSYF